MEKDEKTTDQSIAKYVSKVKADLIKLCRSLDTG
jgi:hypothetical protein